MGRFRIRLVYSDCMRYSITSFIAVPLMTRGNVMSLIVFLIRRLVAAMPLLIAMSVPNEANAMFVPLPVVSGPDWIVAAPELSPGGGLTFLRAYAPYPNPVSVPNPATTSGQLMWYWGEPPYSGIPTGSNGPNQVVFVLQFNLPTAPDPGDQYGAWVAADDFVNVELNEVGVGNYSLDQHKLPNNLPEPIFLDLTNYLRAGENTFILRACDGSLTSCFDRAYEWAFFDAEHGPNAKPSFSPVPEPATVALLAFGALALHARRFVRKLALDTGQCQAVESAETYTVADRPGL